VDMLQEIKKQVKFAGEFVRLLPSEINWLVQTLEQLIEENGAMAEKHAEKDLALAEFMQIVTQQREEIALYKLTESLLLERLKKQTSLIKEMQKNSRLINFYKMAEENLTLAQELERYKEMIKGGAPV
jgi:hypothetical protein